MRIYTSDQEIPEIPWEATYFNGVPIELTAVPNSEYIFSHWAGPGIVYEPTLTLTLSSNINFTAVFIEESNPPIILINEFLADNGTIITDEMGQYEDWIELYYNTEHTINLAGYSLTDNLSEPYMWVFPNIEISGEGFLLIWADNDQEDGPLHTNFKLTSDGEDIGLYDINGNLIDGLSFDAQSEDISYGRVTDGMNEWQFFENPTPGISNEESEQFLLGDMNDDGLLNVLDVVSLVNTILNDDDYILLGDMNQDGVLNVLDIVQLVNFILDN